MASETRKELKKLNIDWSVSTSLYGQEGPVKVKTPLVRQCLTTLKELQLNPASILTLEFDVFGHPLLDDVLVVLRDVQLQPGEWFFRTVSILASCFVMVLERQLDDYLIGKLANPTEVMMQQTPSALLHNIHSKRAPNASIGFVDAKVKCQANKTMDWLLTKAIKEKGRLIKFAVKQARKRKVFEERVQVMSKALMSRQKKISSKCLLSRGREGEEEPCQPHLA
ncbi:Transmembrane protein C17orf113 [Biomphalaria glabrata]|nr:Transmembrane protein C17orf113 [Biomphalaria glabrata]